MRRALAELVRRFHRQLPMDEVTKALVAIPRILRVDVRPNAARRTVDAGLAVPVVAGSR